MKLLSSCFYLIINFIAAFLKNKMLLIPIRLVLKGENKSAFQDSFSPFVLLFLSFKLMF